MQLKCILIMLLLPAVICILEDKLQLEYGLYLCCPVQSAAELLPTNAGIHSMLFQWWPSVLDAGPTLKQLYMNGRVCCEVSAEWMWLYVSSYIYWQLDKSHSPGYIVVFSYDLKGCLYCIVVRNKMLPQCVFYEGDLKHLCMWFLSANHTIMSSW